jgi:hypothetical protein
MKNNFLGSAVGIAVSVAILYGTVYLLSKAWKKGQTS